MPTGILPRPLFTNMKPAYGDISVSYRGLDCVGTSRLVTPRTVRWRAVCRCGRKLAYKMPAMKRVAQCRGPATMPGDAERHYVSPARVKDSQADLINS